MKKAKKDSKRRRPPKTSDTATDRRPGPQHNLPEHELESAAFQLSLILSTLARVFPEPSQAWFPRFVRGFQKVLKYVGLPALILASVIPVYELGTKIKDYQNRRYVSSTYTQYAHDLLERGHPERAEAVITELQKLENLDVRAQWAKAKALAMMAVKKRKKYSEAEDLVRILLRLQRSRGLFFPRLGDENAESELELALLDILLELNQYEEATAILNQFDRRSGDSTVMACGILLRKGRLAVEQFRFEDARQALSDCLGCVGYPPDWTKGRAHFLLGKTAQMSHSWDEAMDQYVRAQIIFEETKNTSELLRVYNNIAMIHFHLEDISLAEHYFKLEEAAARRIDDRMGIARALLSLGTIANRRGHTQAALGTMMEAVSICRELDDRVGLATAFQNTGFYLQKLGQLEDGIANSRRALELFIELEDFRGLGDTAGTLGDMYSDINDYENAVFYLFFSFVCRSHTGNIKARVNLSLLGDIKSTISETEFGAFVQGARDRTARILARMERTDIDVPSPGSLSAGG